MNRHKWQRLLYSLAGLVVVAGVTYACKGFLDQPAQGTVDQATLMNKAGVEGSLVAAYRALDCSSSSGAWGCAVSNWVWGGVTSNENSNSLGGPEQLTTINGSGRAQMGTVNF